MNSPFFIVGTEFSGSSLIASILNLSESINCHIEPTPKLHIETRDTMDGKSINIKELLKKTILERVTAFSQIGCRYGETQSTLGPFLLELYELTGCKFIYVHRDGRDVVKLGMDKNNLRSGRVYRECRFNKLVTDRAVLKASEVLQGCDSHDYSRPRPIAGEALFKSWRSLSREEMLAFYWARINQIHLDMLAELPRECWMSIDCTAPSVEEINSVFEFLDCNAIGASKIKSKLTNESVALKAPNNEAGEYPYWVSWNSKKRTNFMSIAEKEMSLLRYATNKRTQWRPLNFGEVCNETKNIEERYAWIYQGRINAHRGFLKWLQQKPEIESIADFGSGIGYGYRDEITDIEYTGYDISKRVCDIANTNRKSPLQNFICVDYIENELDRKYDLVYSSGTIDNCYDVEAYLAAMVNASSKWIYLSCYRGWFPELLEHQYTYSEDHGCFYNDLSPSLVQKSLEDLGCTETLAYKLKSSNEEIDFETVIVARVN